MVDPHLDAIVLCDPPRRYLGTSAFLRLHVSGIVKKKQSLNANNHSNGKATTCYTLCPEILCSNWISI